MSERPMTPNCMTIRHITRYSFDRPTHYGLQRLRNTPKSTHQQRVLRWETRIEGGRKELTTDDHHNNTVELISFEKGTTGLVIISEGEVAIEETNGVIGRHPGPSPLWLYLRQTPRTKPGVGVRGLVRAAGAGDDLDRLHALMAAIGEVVSYELGASESDWSAEDALSAGRGVCQDHAHVFLSAAREMGFPARYVSGYLMLDAQVAQDAMHAWAEAHVEGLGWVGFDVSNAISPDARYVRVATGLDYGEAAPVTGTRIGGRNEVLSVEIVVAQQ